jgi:hypothetical protein
LINDLYSYDWESYYYSTQSKNNAFIAFQKYLVKTSVNNEGKINISLSKK